jgi:hypothetical protein
VAHDIFNAQRSTSITYTNWGPRWRLKVESWRLKVAGWQRSPIIL